MDYLTLFPSATREKPHFMALAEAILGQATDLIALVPSLESGFSVAQAAGTQLDAIGTSFFVPRQDGWSDETYRSVLQRKLKRNTWDGLNDSSFGYLEDGETFVENGDWTITAETGALPIAADGLLPVPMGVRTVSVG